MQDIHERYTLRQVRSSLSPEKRAADGPWTKFALRPLSMPTAWACLRLGISANAVSYAGAVVAVVGGALMMSAVPWAVWAGIALLFVFGVLDCADGNIARTLRKGNIWGEWVDAVCGYVACTAAILGAGAVAQAQSPSAFPFLDGVSPFWAGGWGLVAGFAAAGNLYMRLIYSGFRRVRPDPERQEVSAEKGLSETIGITGALVPLIALGYALGAEAWVVLAYAVVYVGGAFVVSLKLFGKAQADIGSSK